jgi:UDPglucose--hexose-1-phosphate uridylyltransferase
MTKSELRRDPLTGSWTIFSEARAMNPAFASAKQENGRGDPFLAGREEFAPQTLHEVRAAESWQVRVVPNRAPILGVDGEVTPRADGFYDRMDGVGAHEVVVEDPRTRALEDLPLADVERVVDAWKVRMLDLLRDARMRSFFVVKNFGRAAGSLVPHSVSQVIAMAIIPAVLQRKLDVAHAFFATKKRSIFEDILADEVRTGTRLVYENNGFSVFCPYASRMSFELAIFPKRQCPDFHGITDQERAQLADVLRTAIRKLNRVLDHPAYNLVLHTAPARTAGHEEWKTLDLDFRWHLEILPRLQHVGGIELATGCWVNSVWPEVAADELRNAIVS